MKKLLSTLLIALATLAYAQVPPQQISYQGVARTTAGSILANTPIGIKFEIHQGSTSGTVVFTETHTGISTNSFGLFTTYIGSISNLAVVNWASGAYFIEVSIDPNTGSFSSLGSQQLMSVPYALYSGSAPAPAVSFTNNVLSVGGNTTTITSGSNYTAGNGIDITGGVISNTATPITPTITSTGIAIVTPTTGNNFNVSVPQPSLSYNNTSNVLTLTQGGASTTASLSGTGASTISMTGAGIANVSPTTGSAFTVTVPSPTFNTATGVLAFGTSTVNAVPTLSLTGSTLSSGPGGNSVNLASLPGLWSASSTTAIVQTNNLHNVGIGVTSPEAKFKLDVAATAGNSVTIHGFNTGSTDAFAGVYGENNNSGIGVYGQSTGGKGVFGKSTSDAGVFGESVSGDAGKFILPGTGSTGNAVNAQTNGTGASIRAISINTTSAGAHALHASAASGSAIYAANSSAMAPTIYATNSGTTPVIFSSANDGVAFYGSNISSSGKSVMELASNGDGSALQVYKNVGSTGYVASFVNSAASNASNAVIVSSTGAAHSLYSTNSNSSLNAYAGLFDGGLVSKGKTNTSTAFSFKAFDNGSAELFGVRNDGHVGINATTPAHRLTVIEPNNTNAAIFGSNVSVTANAFAHGIIGRTSNSHALAAAVFGQNSNSGPSIYGVKSPSEVGVAGRFELLSNTNSADAIFAITDGSGAAVHAVSSTTSNVISNTSLWLENGHIKATGATVIIGTTSVVGGFSALGTPSVLANSNDIKGVFSFSTGVTGFATTNYAEIEIKFAKSYTTIPMVNITPLTDLQGLSYMVSNTTINSFFVRVYRSTSMTAPTTISGTPLFKFNYFVVE